MKKEFATYTDEELFEFLKSNSKQTSRSAFEEIYSRYSTNIFTYCRKIVSDEELANDIFQETFTKFFESSKRLVEMTNVAGYLIKIARNLCLNEKSKKYNNNVSLEDFHFPSYDSSNEDRELKEILETAMEALPEDYREVLIMKEYMDMTYKEIAEALGTTLPIVRIRIYRAKNKLRQVMQPYFQDFYE